MLYPMPMKLMIVHDGGCSAENQRATLKLELTLPTISLNTDLPL